MRFGSRGIFVDQTTVDADDFQGAFLEIMSLLRIQCQDLPGYLAVRDDERSNGFRPKAAHGLEAMPAVGCPEASTRRDDCDDRVEKNPVLLMTSASRL